MTATGFSTFFPRDWSRQQVIDAINEAYDRKVLQPGSENVYVGATAAGMLIKLRLDADERIVTAFPMMEGK